MEDDRDVPQHFYASKYILRRRKEAIKGDPPRPSIWHENKSGNISALPYSCALRASASYNYLLVNGFRRLTEREMLRLQGFPESFKITVNYSQARKLAGNSVTVPVIEAIARNMLEALGLGKKYPPKDPNLIEISSNKPDKQMMLSFETVGRDS